MRVYVINLDRRPDRRADMERHAETLGMAFEFISAVDGRDRKNWSTVPGGVTVKGRMSDGDLGCTLSHRKVWQLIIERGEPYAVVLEDDLRFSADSRTFLADERWIPPGEGLIKLERRGRPKRRLALEAASLPAPAGRRLVRFHSRNLGCGGYVVSREAASLLLEATRVVVRSVDHVMFNPALSRSFAQLRPLAVEPAICEQRLDEVYSDIVPTRRKSPAQKLLSGWTEVTELAPKASMGFRLMIEQLAGRIRRQRLTFR